MQSADQFAQCFSVPVSFASDFDVSPEGCQVPGDGNGLIQIERFGGRVAVGAQPGSGLESRSELFANPVPPEYSIEGRTSASASGLRRGDGWLAEC
jgi:hypothetical protein